MLMLVIVAASTSTAASTTAKPKTIEGVIENGDTITEAIFFIEGGDLYVYVRSYNKKTLEIYENDRWRLDHYGSYGTGQVQKNNDWLQQGVQHPKEVEKLATIFAAITNEKPLVSTLKESFFLMGASMNDSFKKPGKPKLETEIKNYLLQMMELQKKKW